MTTILMGAALGGLTLFIWSWLSHMLLPWHHSTYTKFKDADAVEEVLGANTDANAIYISPCGIPEPGASREERQAAMVAAMAKMKYNYLLISVPFKHREKYRLCLFTTAQSRVNIDFQPSPVFLTLTKRLITILIGSFSAFSTTTKKRNPVIVRIPF